MPEDIVSEAGGRRTKIGERWDLIPYEGLVEVAKVLSYGAEKYEPENWKNLDPFSEQSPLNHAMRHCAKATTMEFGSRERIWQLAKVATNALFQLWFETILDQGPDLVENAYAGSDNPETPIKGTVVSTVPAEEHFTPVATEVADEVFQADSTLRPASLLDRLRGALPSKAPSE